MSAIWLLPRSRYCSFLHPDRAETSVKAFSARYTRVRLVRPFRRRDR